MATDDLFWADQLAQKILDRKRFQHIDMDIPKLKQFRVKTSASLSGVLHIGRLSDTIRGDSVFKALEDAGVKTELIWVAENMDPLRKVPEGVPPSFKEYIGMAVTDIPDPHGTHDSYAEHFTANYFKVVDEFVSTPMKKYSMREEYKKGNFNPFIQKILSQVEENMAIQNKYRSKPLPEGWSPWTPICDNCGKIATPHITKIEDGKVHYVCKDYSFEKFTATGCGHEGVNDPLKGNGKLMWKSEWAAQWARWEITSEGAGKEYQVPNSAWWVNAEIVERLLGFPAPEPIFYEHIMIDNVKMSASLGNVVYPKDWLEVAPPEILRIFYNKRLMKTRSFSWKNIPKMYDEFDTLVDIYHGKKKMDNKKEESHLKRLLDISVVKGVPEPSPIAFSHALMLPQIFFSDEKIIESLKASGHYSESRRDEIFSRINRAKVWLEKYAPPEAKFEVQESVPDGLDISDDVRKAIKMVVSAVKENPSMDEVELHSLFYEICREKAGVEPKEFFKASYQILLNRERGPRLARLILALKSKALELLKKA